MNSAPLISILMPAFNAEKFITEAINSIIKQDYPNWELLILNDASTDSTSVIIGSFQDARIKVFHHSNNEGYVQSCNELFGKAKGAFITFLDADDACAENRLSLCLEEFAQHPELDFLTTNHHRNSDSGQAISENMVDVDYNRYSKDSSYHPTICCATAFLRKTLLDKVGGYQPFFATIGGEDYFWIWELSRAGKGTHIVKSLYHYRQHALQTSKTHQNQLSLFVPELLCALKHNLLDSSWDNTVVTSVERDIREKYLKSAFQLNLRMAEAALNQHHPKFRQLAKRAFVNIRQLNEMIQFAVLLKSWTARQLG